MHRNMPCPMMSFQAVVLDQYFYPNFESIMFHSLNFRHTVHVQQTYNSAGEKDHKHETETKIIK